MREVLCWVLRMVFRTEEFGLKPPIEETCHILSVFQIEVRIRENLKDTRTWISFLESFLVWPSTRLSTLASTGWTKSICLFYCITLSYPLPSLPEKLRREKKSVTSKWWCGGSQSLFQRLCEGPSQIMRRHMPCLTCQSAASFCAQSHTHRLNKVVQHSTILEQV